VQFGDAAFGSRYGAYVQSMTRAISQAWLRGLVNIPQRTAPRVYLTFTIARDGSVSNITIKQSSGIPQLDRSADRAIRAADLPQLPTDYRGSNVTVEFYFEYVR
jgi:protein TonB